MFRALTTCGALDIHRMHLSTMPESPALIPIALTLMTLTPNF
jgi:hypothetical protein